MSALKNFADNQTSYDIAVDAVKNELINKQNDLADCLDQTQNHFANCFAKLSFHVNEVLSGKISDPGIHTLSVTVGTLYECYESVNNPRDGTQSMAFSIGRLFFEIDVQ